MAFARSLFPPSSALPFRCVPLGAHFQWVDAGRLRRVSAACASKTATAYSGELVGPDLRIGLQKLMGRRDDHARDNKAATSTASAKCSAAHAESSSRSMHLRGITGAPRTHSTLCKQCKLEWGYAYSRSPKGFISSVSSRVKCRSERYEPGGSPVSKKDLLLKLEQQDARCFYSGTPLNIVEPHVH